LPVVAAGQEPPVRGQVPVAAPQPLPAQGDVSVSHVEHGYVVGGGVKFATVGGEQALYVGPEAGAVFDGRLLVGGGLWLRLDRAYETSYSYWSGDTRTLEPGDVYGGLMLGWRAVRTNAVSITARGLVGAGLVKVGWNGSQGVLNPIMPRTGPNTLEDGSYLFDQGYFVFEPQVDVSVLLGPHLALGGGVGYRMIGWAAGFEDQLKGMTVSFSVQWRPR
jgi:hypothetical protein